VSVSQANGVKSQLKVTSGGICQTGVSRRYEILKGLLTAWKQLCVCKPKRFFCGYKTQHYMKIMLFIEMGSLRPTALGRS